MRGMNWNDSLYWYWRERGGDFYASAAHKDSGFLMLDMPDGPALIQCESVSDYNGGTPRREISVVLRASLERPYYLTVRKENFSGAVPARPSDPELDDGVPELTARRSVCSSDGSLTPYLLQNRRFQALLAAEPGAWLQISPIQAGGLEHLVSVRKDAENLEEAVDSQGRAAGRDEPNQRKLYAESGFREQMDSMVDLAQTAREEVNLWPRQGRRTEKTPEEGKP